MFNKHTQHTHDRFVHRDALRSSEHPSDPVSTPVVFLRTASSMRYHTSRIRIKANALEARSQLISSYVFVVFIRYLPPPLKLVCCVGFFDKRFHSSWSLCGAIDITIVYSRTYTYLHCGRRNSHDLFRRLSFWHVNTVYVMFYCFCIVLVHIIRFCWVIHVQNVYLRDFEMHNATKRVRNVEFMHRKC